jgi:CRISPR/Cas system CSM-associated protein Csm3 (group 7 of RAMP superfamily)
MINGRNEYIIPATSIKGAFRNRMEMISGYLQLPTTVIEDTFGSESRDKKAKLGNIQFFDCILGNIDNEGNSRAKKNTRIKIDKFTGGVMNQALFTEAPVDTQTEFRIRLKGDNINSSLGLLFYALRDISIGAFSLGGGSNIGHGFIEVLTIQCKKNNDIIIEIDGGKVKKGLDVLESYLKIG